MKKKILFMMYYMNCGGVEKALLNILNILEPDHYDVTVLFVKKKGDYLKYIPAWVNIEEVDIPKDEALVFFKGSRHAIIEYLVHGNVYQAIKKLYRACKFNRLSTGWEKSVAYFEEISSKIPVMKKAYDVAIDFHGYTSFTTFFVAEKVNAPIKASWIHSIFRQFNPRPFYKYYNKYKHVFCVSKKCEEEFSGFFPEFKNKTSLFYNIVCSDPIISMSKVDKGFNDNYKGTRILTVGRLSYPKGYDIAIPIFARLKSDGYNIKWYVVGEGEERASLEQLIKKYAVEDSFILLGFCSNPYPYIAQCDIYLQPSRYEGNPLTLTEARVFNKPIICTDFAGAREQIADGETGLIVDLDEEKIYYAIKQLISDKELREKFSYNLSRQKVDNISEINKLYQLINSNKEPTIK